ncbi:metal dependent phosphohydrolase [Clostridium aceticum]|uniref:Metal dependent phosphohydrolase n=1 Tax=Clostridium aceticum TaxID=84022 RepID=A0A0G3W8G2_9CLOT|nr:HD-GYP domain-containing protein [Clostridium aceticum]AKL94150.1 metal dependent phosphohydrolase [Clostridium aceticum]
MEKIYLSEIENGTPINCDLCNDKGVILVKKGTRVTEELKKKLQKNNIIFLIGNSSPFDNLEDSMAYLDEVVVKQIQETKQVYKQTFYQLSREFETFKTSDRLDKKMVTDIAKSLVSNIATNQQVYMSIQGIRSKDIYTYLHSIDVSIFMILFGKSLSLDPMQLVNAATAGILHDIGKMKIPDHVLLKPEKLLPEEMEVMKKHTIYGYEILKNHLGYEESIARVAKEHHERMDKGGYPQGVGWENLHLFSKMTAICDIYDAITAQRVYKKPMLPHKATEYLMTVVGTHLDQELVRRFVHNIATYPLGAKVLLNTGEEGIVISINNSFPQRPVIKIINTNKIRDLLVELTIFIKEVLE